MRCEPLVPCLTLHAMIVSFLAQAFSRSLDVPSQQHSEAVHEGIRYVLSSSSRQLPHTLPPIATSWCSAVETLLTYVNNVLRNPSDTRRINRTNPALLRRMGPLPLPDVHQQGGFQLWPGVSLLHSVGWLDGSDGYIHLPVEVSALDLAARSMELRAVLTLLQSAAALEAHALSSATPSGWDALRHTVLEKSAKETLSSLKAALDGKSAAHRDVEGAKKVVAASVPTKTPVASTPRKVLAPAAPGAARPVTSSTAPNVDTGEKPMQRQVAEHTPALAVGVAGPLAASTLLADAEARVEAQMRQIQDLENRVSAAWSPLHLFFSEMSCVRSHRLLP